MKKHNKLIMAAIFLVCLACVFLFTLYRIDSLKKLMKMESKSYKPISVNSTGSSDYIALNQGTSLEMLNASYWIDARKAAGADPEAILWNAEEIQYFNYANRKMLGIGNVVFDYEEIGEDFSGKSVKALINDMIESFNGLSGYTVNSSKPEDGYYDDLVANTGLAVIPALVHPRFGFSVRNDSLQRLPSDDLLLRKGGTLYYDRMPNTELLPFEPVVVLWTSVDGEWSLVLRNSSGGWVRSDAIAYCIDKQEWLACQNPQNFLMVTGKEIHLTVDPYEPELSGMALPMGTKLSLVSLNDIPAEIHNRSTYGCYVVSIPARGVDGMLEYKLVPIPVSEDVHIGYLDFTEANILKLAFKHLGSLYGWAGENNAQDCSGYAKEIYACFGITLPRTSAAQIQLQAVKNMDVRIAPGEKKLEILKSAPAGTLLYLPGHIMLYTGMIDGEPYCISSAGSIVTEEIPEGAEIQTNEVILTSLFQTLRSDRRSWLEALTMITMIK